METEHPTGLVQRTNDEYHSGPGISKSHLDTVASASLKHYWQRYINPDREPTEKTPALIMGEAIHRYVLEPDTASQTIAVNPGIDRRSSAGKAEYAQFIAESAGKLIITDEQFLACAAIRDAVYAHPFASLLLSGGRAEQSFYAKDAATGELIKCRTDYLHDSGEFIVDLKSTENASPTEFARSAANFRYPMQTAWYHRVLDTVYGEHPTNWVFLAVEKSPPYAIGVYYCNPADVKRAADAAQGYFERIVNARRTGQFPDYATEALPLNMPGYWKP